VDVLNKGIIYNCNLSITPAVLFKVIPVSDRDGVRLIVLGGMIGGAAISGLYSAEIISMQTM